VTKTINRMHTRIVIGGVVLLAAFLAWIYLLDGGMYFGGGGPR